MRTQSMDTRPEAEMFQIALLRKTPLTKSFNSVRGWTYQVLQMNRQGIQKKYPNATEEERALIFVTHTYGKIFANGLQEALKKRQVHISSKPDLLLAMIPVTEIFDQFEIPYHIAGSIPITSYGMRRSILEIELVADLHPEHAHPLLKGLETAYAIDEGAIQDAIEHRTSFSGIHFESLMKFDVSVLKDRPFDQEVQHRAQRRVLDEDVQPFCLASPEDVILTQLEGYRRGGEKADDQWNDILGMLKVQGTPLNFTYLQRWATAIDLPYQLQWTSPLDLVYLEKWATNLEVPDLLERALLDAGIRS